MLNKESPEQIYINALFGFMTLFNNMTVLTADLFFEDWLSFAYYLGDTVYHLLVVNYELTLSFD